MHALQFHYLLQSVYHWSMLLFFQESKYPLSAAKQRQQTPEAKPKISNRKPTMKYIGAHVSAAGGVQNAPVNAHRIGASAFAFFTKNQRCLALKTVDAIVASVASLKNLPLISWDKKLLKTTEIAFTPEQWLGKNV